MFVAHCIRSPNPGTESRHYAPDGFEAPWPLAPEPPGSAAALRVRPPSVGPEDALAPVLSPTFADEVPDAAAAGTGSRSCRTPTGIAKG